MSVAQASLFGSTSSDDDVYIKSQLITYLGNKRALLPLIDAGIRHARNELGGREISFLDLFSGSGVVSRLARRHSRFIHCNDLERYSFVANSCYQTNIREFDKVGFAEEFSRLNERISDSPFSGGFISDMYAPRDDNSIQPGERAFYTRENALFLDAFCIALRQTSVELRPFFLAPVLAQASMHANTSGVFKGFYKNVEGVGQFGGTARNALTRIMRKIELQAPILSKRYCQSFVHQKDANALIGEVDAVDVAYFDPPYNQHPYGSNYFMLNLLCEYKQPDRISKVSGIPVDWNRSDYNKSKLAEAALFDAVERVRASFVLISYNSEGFISHETFLDQLAKIGCVSVMDARYNAFRGSRNLADREMHVTEFLYLVDKR